MLAIANQTTRPNWLKFFNGTKGYPGDNKGYKNSIFFEDLNYFTNFLIIFLINGQRRALQLVIKEFIISKY